MKIMKKKWVAAFFVLVVALYAEVWVCPPYSSRVVNEQGKPLKDAVVGVGWTLRHNIRYPLLFLETKTDQNGVFSIPGWVRLSPFPFAYMRGSPVVYVLREGYLPLRIGSHALRLAFDASLYMDDPFVLVPIDGVGHASARQTFEWFAADMCSDLGSGPIKITEGNILFRNEMQKIDAQLPAKTKSRALQGLSICY